MKRKNVLFASLVFFGASASFAQTTTVNQLGQEVTYMQASEFMVLPKFSDWPDAEDGVITKEYKQRDVKVAEYKDIEFTDQKDGALQVGGIDKSLMTPKVNFNGLSGNGYPPDPSGAAGPNHYVQAVNTSYRVYDKNGSPLTTPKNLSSLWPGSANLGDPIVMYDRHADRWFISQFKQSPNGILIAISQTNDPTGAYYAYSFNLTQFPDYPKYSIWWDAYYMTSNSSHTAVAFDRTKMLAGDPTAGMISLSLPSLNNYGFRSPLSADADGDLPPNGTPCYFFNLEDDAFSGVSQDQIEIYEMTCNWTTPASSSVSSAQILPVAAFDGIFTGGFANISQPGTTQRLDAIMDVFMYRAQYMRWTGYNTLMLSHAVDLGSNRSGIRWYELRNTDGGTWSVFQQGTFAPDNVNRWMSSVAMDNFGNIGMGYSVSDATSLYPSIRFTARNPWATPGTFNYAEATAIAGTASQTVTDRYGDYAHLCLDPDGRTFWYTGEYIGTGGAPRTRIFSFDVQEYAGLENPYYESLEMAVTQGDDQINVTVKGIYGNDELTLDLIGMDGRVISEKLVNPVNGTLEETLNAANLGTGIYFVRVGSKNFQKVTRIFK